MGIWQAYAQLWAVVRLPPVRELALLLLAFRLGCLPAEQAAPLKLLDKGVSKEALAGLVRACTALLCEGFARTPRCMQGAVRRLPTNAQLCGTQWGQCGRPQQQHSCTMAGRWCTQGSQAAGPGHSKHTAAPGRRP